MSMFLSRMCSLYELATVPTEAGSLRARIVEVPDGLRAAKIGLGRARKLFFANLFLVAPGIRLATAEPLHADAGGKNAKGNHRNHLAPTECAAHLDCSAEESWVDQRCASSCRQGERGTFDRAAAQNETANERDDRTQQEETRQRQCGDQRLITRGHPNEGGNDDESARNRPEYH